MSNISKLPVQIFFCVSVVLKLLCYHTTSKREQYDWMAEKIWTGSSTISSFNNIELSEGSLLEICRKRVFGLPATGQCVFEYPIQLSQPSNSPESITDRCNRVVTSCSRRSDYVIRCSQPGIVLHNVTEKVLN